MELIKALETIKQHCEKHTICSTCALRNNTDYCYIVSNDLEPRQWVIVSEKAEPKVFE